MESSLNSQIDDTVPLVFEKGWTHLTCNGPAEKSIHYGECYCIDCGRTVPSKEVGKDVKENTKLP